MRVYNEGLTPSELTFRDEIKGEYNITQSINDVYDDYIATALMLFKVGEVTLDEAVCYFGYVGDSEGSSKDKIYNHNKVAKLVREATSTISSWEQL